MILQVIKDMNWKKNIFQWRVKVYDDANHYPNCIYERIINEYGNKYSSLYDVIATLKENGLIFRCSDSDVDFPLQARQVNAVIDNDSYTIIKRGLDSNV